MVANCGVTGVDGRLSVAFVNFGLLCAIEAKGLSAYARNTYSVEMSLG